MMISLAFAFKVMIIVIFIHVMIFVIFGHKLGKEGKKRGPPTPPQKYKFGSGVRKKKTHFLSTEKRKRRKEGGNKEKRERKKEGGEERRKERKKGGKKRNVNVLLG